VPESFEATTQSAVRLARKYPGAELTITAQRQPNESGCP